MTQLLLAVLIGQALFAGAWIGVRFLIDRYRGRVGVVPAEAAAMPPSPAPAPPSIPTAAMTAIAERLVMDLGHLSNATELAQLMMAADSAKQAGLDEIGKWAHSRAVLLTEAITRASTQNPSNALALFVCITCKRMQTYAPPDEDGGCTVAEAKEIGWSLVFDGPRPLWLCPFCSQAGDAPPPEDLQ